MGKGTHIKGAIVDKNARIGKFCKIVNAEGIQVRVLKEDPVMWGVCIGVGRPAPTQPTHRHSPPSAAASAPEQESFKTEDDGWVIRDGVVVIIKDSNIPDGKRCPWFWVCLLMYFLLPAASPSPIFPPAAGLTAAAAMAPP